MPSNRVSEGTRRAQRRAFAFIRRHPLWSLLIAAVAIASATTGLLSVGAWPVHILSERGSGATDIEVDSRGNLHVAFTAPSSDSPGGKGSLYYATNARGGWSVSLLDDVHEVEDVALARGPADDLHVAYTAWVRDDTRLGPPTVRYVSIGGPGSASELVDASGSHPAIAVNSAGRVHVTYSADFDLVHATRTAGTWTIETVGLEAEFSDLALDSRGNVHAIFSAGIQDYGYATNAGGSWSYESFVHDGNDFRSRVPIAVDDGGRVHIAYSRCGGCDSAQVVYGVREGGSWTYEAIATRSRLSPAFVDLAMDPAGRPHVLFSDKEANTITHVERTADGWRSRIVDRATTLMIGGSIAITPGGKVAISYVRWDTGPGREVRAATFGVDKSNFIDFVWGISPILLVEGGLFLAAGVAVWLHFRAKAARMRASRV
jgi:hypothetical protein